MRSRILLGAIFGAVGGLLGFLLQEFTTPHDLDMETLSQSRQMMYSLVQGLLIGSMLGVAIGAVEGVVVGSPRLVFRGAAVGGVIGLFGGLLGMYFGSFVFNLALFGKPYTELQASRQILDFVHLVIARTLGFTFLGMLPGLAAGAATKSWRRAKHGLIGGLIGGFLGGLLFDLVATVLQPVLGTAAALQGQSRFGAGGPSRAIGFTLIGLLTGLFIGLVEEMLKQAWVRVLAGRNEGKDYIISNAMTVLGRDERADVPLFGDPMLAPQHAAIRIEGNRHYLLDGKAPPAPLVNGQAFQEKQLLKDGDMIQMGQVRILFREKATASRVGRQPVDQSSPAQSPGAVAMPAHLCPFCGAQKDAQGNCLCNVAGAAPAPQVGYPGPVAPDFPGATYPVPQSPALPPILPSSGSRLVGLDGPYAAQVFALDMASVTLLTIGRSPENAVSLSADSAVSRMHAHIVAEGGAHVVYDDGSSNGTFVNNVRIGTQALAPGDIVQFGSSRFRYE